MIFPGSITDIAGLAVGHATESGRPTGCTVVLCAAGATCGVDVRGAAPGTRETDLLRPDNLVEQAHAVLLAGGSAFGLDAAAGVMRWLEERGHGFAVGPVVGAGETATPVRVPIVPAAVLFDLWVGDPRIRPGADSGHAACKAASFEPPAQGNVGAGAGATVGKLFGIDRAMKGGIGSASLRIGSVTVGAGDRVVQGQVIAAVGSSGTTGGPHLHFQVTDRPSVLFGSGLPYVFDAFVLVGQTPPLAEVIPYYDTLEPIPVTPERTGPREAELPLGRDVVTFPAS